MQWQANLMQFPPKIVLLRGFFGISSTISLPAAIACGRARAVRRDWRFAYGVARRYHAAHLVWNARERRGSGTYVCPPKLLNIFQETYNFSDAVRTAGLHPSSRLVSTGAIEADEALADKLGVAVGAPCSACSVFDLLRRAGVNRDGSR